MGNLRLTRSAGTRIISIGAWGLAAAILLLNESGCASVEYKVGTRDSPGLRYYASAPYLLVYSDGKGGIVWEIITLPDLSRVLTAQPTGFWSKAQLNLSFQNGIVQQTTAGGDSTTVPAAIIAAASTVVQGALTLGLRTASAASKSAESPIPAPTIPAPTIPGFPAPYLFKITVTKNGIVFTGSQGSTVIRVPASALAKT